MSVLWDKDRYSMNNLQSENYPDSFLLSIQRGMECACQEQRNGVPHENFGLHFNSKQQATKENPEKCYLIYRKQLYTLEINIY